MRRRAASGRAWAGPGAGRAGRPATSSCAEQLPGPARAPHLRQRVPAVVEQDARVDQRHRGQRLGVVGRPGQPPAAAEVVEHEVRAADAERLERPGQVAGVAAVVVGEGGGLVGLAEARHVEGQRAAAALSHPLREVLPVVDGARVAVDEHDRLPGLRRTRLERGRAHARDEHLPAARGRHVSATARADRASIPGIRANGLALRVPTSSRASATRSSRAAPANMSRSMGLSGRPLA